MTHLIRNPFSRGRHRVGLAAAAGLLVLAASSTVLAAGHSQGHHGDRFPIDLNEMENRAQARFAAADTNANSVIELEEFVAADTRRSHRAHKSKGHKRSKGAQRRHLRNMDPQQREAMQAAVRDASFALLDTDGDGNISTQEYNSADHRSVRNEARKRAMFSQLDADNNGSLSADEMPSRLDRLRNMDSDGDGQVTREEFRAGRRDSRA